MTVPTADSEECTCSLPGEPWLPGCDHAAWKALDCLNLPVLVINRNHVVAHANPAAHAQFLAEQGMICFKRLLGSSESCEVNGRGCVLEKFWHDTQVISGLHEILQPDGSLKLAAISAAPVLGQDGLPEQAIVTFQDLTDSIWLQHALYSILTSTASSTGATFLLDLVEQISRNTQFEHVLIGRFLPEQQAVLSLAFYSDGEQRPQIHYTIAGAPCGSVLQGRTVLITDQAGERYPDDEFIRTAGVNSYAGVPLRDSRGAVFGLFAAMSSKELKNPDVMKLLLQAFAARTAGELERIEMEDQLLKAQASLEREMSRRTAALRESQSRYQWLFDSSSDALAVIELVPEPGLLELTLGRFLMVNQAAAKLSGYSRTELLELSPRDFSPPQTASRTPAILEELRVRGYAQFEAEVTSRAGNRFPVEFHVQQLELDGKPVLLATARDISKRLAAEAALRKSEERFRSIVESTPVGMCISDASGRFEYCNSSFCQTFGYQPEELLGQHITITAREEDLQLVQAAHFNVVHGDGEFRGEMRVQRKDGTPLVVLMDAMRINGLDGAPRKVAFILDITASKHSQELEQQMALLAELAPEPIIRFDPQGCVQLANSAGAVVLDHRIQAGQDLRELIPELADFDFAHCISDGLSHDQAFSRGERNFRATIRGVPELGFGQLYATDITATVNAQRQAEAASIAKSRFLANMSHELRTPLSAINGFSEVLLEQTFGPLTATQQEYLERINQSGSHLLSLISDLLDLAKIEAGKLELVRETVDLRVICTEACDLISGRVRQHGLQLVLNLPEEPAPYYGDILRLRQVAINLLSNAVKFTKHGSVTVTLEAREGMYQLIVEDTGIGIAAEELTRLFQRFEQVHDRRLVNEAGTGLGLALCREIITAHGGVISVESTPGAGSKFTASLPRN